jgi:hypothetical protein
MDNDEDRLVVENLSSLSPSSQMISPVFSGLMVTEKMFGVKPGAKLDGRATPPDGMKSLMVGNALTSMKLKLPKYNVSEVGEFCT